MSDMLCHSNKDPSDGLDFYDPEGRLFPKLMRTSDERRKLSKRDILLILKWKLGRIKGINLATIRDDNLSKINNAVDEARTPGCEAAALKALADVPGIGLATATAILTLCYPDRFTIIDQRVLGCLRLFPARMPVTKRNRYSTSDWTPEEYLEMYLPAVRLHSEKWGCSLRDADRALWGFSIREQIKRIIEKSNLP